MWGPLPNLTGQPQPQIGNFTQPDPNPVQATPIATGTNADGMALRDPAAPPPSPDGSSAFGGPIPSPHWTNGAMPKGRFGFVDDTGSRPWTAGGTPWAPAPQGQPAPQGTLSGPGDAETFYAENKGAFTAPGPAQTFFGQNQDAFTAPSNATQHFNAVRGRTAPTIENRAEQAYDQYQNQMPGFIDAPDLGSFYDFAEGRALDTLGKQQAARGVFGSTVASGQAGDVSANLRAQQANREADYNLARNADRRATLFGAGELARSADITDIADAEINRGWTDMLGGLASRGDMADSARLGLGVSSAGSASGERLAGLNAGMGAAGISQTQEQMREQMALNDLVKLFGLFGGIAGNTYENVLGTDMALMDGELSGGLAGASSAYNMDEADRAQIGSELFGGLSVLSGLGWRPFAPVQNPNADPRWPDGDPRNG